MVKKRNEWKNTINFLFEEEVLDLVDKQINEEAILIDENGERYCVDEFGERLYADEMQSNLFDWWLQRLHDDIVMKFNKSYYGT